MARTLAHYMFGTFATRIVQFLFLPIYTSYLTTADSGYYRSVEAYVQVLMPLAYLSIWDAILRLGFERKDQESRTAFFSTAMTVVFGLSALYLAVGAGLEIAGVRNALLVALMATSSALLTVWQSASRAMENSKSYSASTFLSAATSIGVNIALIMFFRLGATGLMIANITANLCTVAVSEAMIKLRRYIRPGAFSRATFKETFKYVRHFIIGTTAWKLHGMCSPLVIPLILGYGANGIYSIALNFHAVLGTLSYVYHLAWQEEMMRRENDSEREKMFNNVYAALLRLAFGVLVTVLPATFIVFPYVVKGEFAQALAVIPIVYLDSIVNLLVLHVSSVFLMARDTLANLIDTVTGSVATIALMLLLGPPFGLYGIASASVLGSFARLFVCRKMARRHLRPNLRIPQLALLVAAYAIVVIALCCTNDTIWYFAVLAAACAFAALLNRDAIRRLLRAARTGFASRT